MSRVVAACTLILFSSISWGKGLCCIASSAEFVRGVLSSIYANLLACIRPSVQCKVQVQSCAKSSKRIQTAGSLLDISVLLIEPSFLGIRTIFIQDYHVVARCY